MKVTKEGWRPGMTGRLNKAQIEQRRDYVMAMLLRGHTLRRIAANVGVSHPTVIKDRDARLKQLAKNNPAPQQYRELQIARLNRLLRVAMPLALGRSEEVDSNGIVLARPVPPDPVMLDRALRIIDKLNALYGLDSRDVINVNVETPQFLRYTEISTPAGEQVSLPEDYDDEPA